MKSLTTGDLRNAFNIVLIMGVLPFIFNCATQNPNQTTTQVTSDTTIASNKLAVEAVKAETLPDNLVITLQPKIVVAETSKSHNGHKSKSHHKKSLNIDSLYMSVSKIEAFDGTNWIVAFDYLNDANQQPLTVQIGGLFGESPVELYRLNVPTGSSYSEFRISLTDGNYFTLVNKAADLIPLTLEEEEGDEAGSIQIKNKANLIVPVTDGYKTTVAFEINVKESIEGKHGNYEFEPHIALAGYLQEILPIEKTAAIDPRLLAIR